MNNSERDAASFIDDGRYRLLVDAVRDYAIYMLDPKGIISSWNAGAQRFKGYLPEEIIGSHFSRFYTPEDREAGVPSRALETAVREGKFEAEGWRVRKDGSRFWAHVIIDPIMAPNGELLGFAKITRDLTERRQAEEVLRRSQEQFRILVEGVTDYSIFLLDPNGHISSWNAGAERIKGYSAEEIVGEHFSRFYSEEDRQNGLPARALETAKAEGRFEAEGWRVRKDGTKFWAHVIIDAIRAESGDLMGFAKVTRDATERRAAQEALEQAREALFQSQKMEAIGQLTGGIAHDFNNLLTVILGSLELAKKRISAESKAVPLIDNALSAAHRGRSLTQRMLSFARRQSMNLVPVDVPDLVKGMSELLERSLGPSIPVEFSFPLSLPDALADHNQLELAILNLAVNARDAMPDGGIIKIGARVHQVREGSNLGLPAGRYVGVSITDTGLGMDDATLARAAEPFFTTKGVGKGTGLGLSMVHGMAEQSGGRLILKSREGEGTTAEIWLPVVEASAPSETIIADDRHQQNVARLKVLAVDDDALVLMNTAEMLRDFGHVVVEASSAQQALDIIEGDSSFDLIITDHLMPKMTGLQLAERIREQGSDLPVVVATGFAEMSDDNEVAFVKLSKPFSEKELGAAIAVACGGGSRGAVVQFRGR